MTKGFQVHTHRSQPLSKPRFKSHSADPSVRQFVSFLGLNTRDSDNHSTIASKIDIVYRNLQVNSTEIFLQLNLPKVKKIK